VRAIDAGSNAVVVGFEPQSICVPPKVPCSPTLCHTTTAYRHRQGQSRRAAPCAVLRFSPTCGCAASWTGARAGPRGPSAAANRGALPAGLHQPRSCPARLAAYHRDQDRARTIVARCPSSNVRPPCCRSGYSWSALPSIEYPTIRVSASRRASARCSRLRCSAPSCRSSLLAQSSS
jgi:hypothetical protein